ncbi:3beta-hydroxysteroid-dehydrogenase/decarboxylase isoform 1 [Madurella mycetomatis]|uniref:3beta-hydroxysteroid-dehydrogenase/decarboxylase isoform 1 n=1 Tax=Madurella mycetomatis TaxID=100816 RepID=A0A175W0Y7_9PEZI|nr:3beta-hydroxysteroid-dehydrogenase/decarboxylase isoform 1 [Madurella mycetomatis]
MASSAEPPKILLTGATGYIGGTVLNTLLSSPFPLTSPITCLLRGPSRAATLTAAYGTRIQPALHANLDDVATTMALAAQHDIVINTALGYHPASAAALVRGLAQRRVSTGRDVWIVHTSGTSNLADQPFSVADGRGVVEREFDDASDDVYGYENQLEGAWSYAQRETELRVVELGEELGVKTVVVMSPTIFGVGTGLFNRVSIQIPAYVKAAVAYGRGVVVGDGKGVWDHVHVEDLAELYKMLVTEILERGGERVPTGRKGIIFSANGRHTWMEVAQGVAEALWEEGKIADKRVESIRLAEGAKILAPHMGGDNEQLVELGLSSNSRTVSNVARKLGWTPTKGEEWRRRGFREDVKAVVGETIKRR